MLAIVPFYLELVLTLFGVDDKKLRDLRWAFLVVRILRVLRVKLAYPNLNCMRQFDVCHITPLPGHPNHQTGSFLVRSADVWNDVAAIAEAAADDDHR